MMWPICVKQGHGLAVKFKQIKAQNYNPPLKLRKTVVKVTNFNIKKNASNTETKLIGFIM